MKWSYILIVLVVLVVLVVATLASGCVDKEQARTPAQTPAPPGESAVTPAAGASSQASEDIFETESNLSALDTTFEDMNMEVSLLDTI